MTLYDFRRNPTAEPRPSGRPRLPREHGTERGFQQHRTDRTPPCGRCLYAHQLHNTRPP